MRKQFISDLQNTAGKRKYVLFNFILTLKEIVIVLIVVNVFSINNIKVSIFSFAHSTFVKAKKNG